jgi:hypothetical protein
VIPAACRRLGVDSVKLRSVSGGAQAGWDSDELRGETRKSGVQCSEERSRCKFVKRVCVKMYLSV